MLAAATSSPAATVVFRQPAALGGRGLGCLTQGIIKTRNFSFPGPGCSSKASGCCKEAYSKLKVVNIRGMFIERIPYMI
jgi:hypothetical protein